eukprot:15449310-Alexandrium_andersonii.AAC.1
MLPVVEPLEAVSCMRRQHKSVGRRRTAQKSAEQRLKRLLQAASSTYWHLWVLVGAFRRAYV